MAAGTKGITISRLFTREGRHPYGTLEWDIRDAVIPNFKEGGNAFEQKDVEFPKSWSQNATNIVAQKYFRGPLGTPERERSVKQLIDRVADTISAWGWYDGYFADEDSRQIFNEELKAILVTQRAAFNSPVWFNVGSEPEPQCSACFILAVEDTMSSILNWYVEEGTIFKGGSGSGINLSTIRSSKERMSAGGEASGPVSFMRGADSSAGTIKSGGKTRRAAKMVVLNVDHADVLDFIWCKAIEERKARDLAGLGWDMDLDGKDAYSIQYQNANNSVRVTDEFMRAYVKDRDWALRAVRGGDVVETLRARDLMRQMAQAAWECADPGIQYDTTINNWHTSPNSGRINASNPCSEYMHLDNSACNLASLNLIKFLAEDGLFMIEEFKHTVDIMFLAQEILVGNSSYPTDKIAANAKAFRELGIGYANLGAMLMALGLPYDSDAGRAWGGAVTALLTGHSYRNSARFAEAVGPYDGYAPNNEAHIKVIEKHQAAADEINPDLVPAELLEAAKESWSRALGLGAIHGYRNSQASVLAPTGTIGLMMDCDTTGVEPDLALVKTKKLVGGGTMKIVNQTVRRALANLGYASSQADEIVAFIAENNTVLGAPHIKEQDLAVFDCSMGTRPIHWSGHVKMMAAVQPFISGAISKTINMPEHVTVEEVEEVMVEGWKLGLKAIAIYRDNCKVAQPLSADKKPAAAESVQVYPEYDHPHRRRLSKDRVAHTTSFEIFEYLGTEIDTLFEGYMTAGLYEDGSLGELFLKGAKQGGLESGLLDMVAIALSIGIQYGAPIEAFVSKFMNMRFPPAGRTDDPEIREVLSLGDLIGRTLAFRYMPEDARQKLGILSRKERAALYGGGQAEEKEETVPVSADASVQLASQPAERADAVALRKPDHIFCPKCGNKVLLVGPCPTCDNCSWQQKGCPG